MTSGPMPINALPPERQPDPQVVAWMQAYLRDNPHAGLKELPRVFIGEELDPMGEFSAKNWPTLAGPLLPEHWVILKASAEAAKGPLTVADIPAGQGPASLYLHDGHLYHRGADGRSRPVEYSGWHEAVDAVDALLAAHLPTLATEEAAGETTQPYPPTTVDALAALIATYLRSGSDGDIIGLAHDLEDALGVEASDALWREAHALAAADPLFDTPQVATDDEGRHWRQGREYVAVDVDGELDYQPKETPMTETPTPTRAGLNADHLPLLARLIEVADQADVTIRYCCWNSDWGIMTTPQLDDVGGAAFLAALDVGDIGQPQQIDPNGNRSLFAGTRFEGGVRLWVAPIPTDTAEEGA